jgi:transposase
MRGDFQDQGGLLSYVRPEERIPADHPLRKVRDLVREVLKELNRTFSRLYSREGRPSIPPEQLLSVLLLQVFYGIRSERQLLEQLDYNLLFRWFVGLSPDDRVWDATTFTKNRERLQRGQVLQKFMAKLLDQPKVKALLSDDHFSVDGTLIEAWASHKSFKPKEGDKDDDGSDFHGQRRKNDTHASTSDPDAKLYRKAVGREARLSYMGHAPPVTWVTVSRSRAGPWSSAFSAGGSSTAPCARPSIVVSPPSPPTSCSISSPTISSASPS